MRSLNLIGSCLVILGIYVFTSGASGSFRYALPGGVIAGAGLVMLAFAAVIGGLPEVSNDQADRPRRRSLAARPDELNHEPVAE